MVAMKAYDNPHCKTLVEFDEDLSKFSNLARLTAREIGPIETHLLLNNVMTLLNIFENDACVKMMFYKVKKCDWYKLKTILTYLNRMPNIIPDVEVNNSEIELCQEMMESLQKI